MAVKRRWSSHLGRYGRFPEVDNFLAEIAEVCKRHGMSISAEDHHGAFEVGPFDEKNVEWLDDAHWIGSATKEVR